MTTSVGAEGIPNPDDVMAIADNPEAFATAICHFLTTDSGVSGEATQRWLADHYSLAKAEEAINDLMARQSRSCQ